MTDSRAPTLSAKSSCSPVKSQYNRPDCGSQARDDIAGRLNHEAFVSIVKGAAKCVATVVGLGLSCSVLGGALAMAGTNLMEYDRKLDDMAAPYQVAVMGQGTARTDYGVSHARVRPITDDSNDMRKVGAADGSERSSGAVAVGDMMNVLRGKDYSYGRITVHAYDPFVKDASGELKLNLKGIRQIAPILADYGVKVTVVPFSVSNSPDGREFSKIMKENGIALFAPSVDGGCIGNVPGVITVRGQDGGKRAQGNFEVKAPTIAATGCMAGLGAFYAANNPDLKGSDELGKAMQDKMIRGTKLDVSPLGMYNRQYGYVTSPGALYPGVSSSSGSPSTGPSTSYTASQAAARSSSDLW